MKIICVRLEFLIQYKCEQKNDYYRQIKNYDLKKLVQWNIENMNNYDRNQTFTKE